MEIVTKDIPDKQVNILFKGKNKKKFSIRKKQRNFFNRFFFLCQKFFLLKFFFFLLKIVLMENFLFVLPKNFHDKI